jgi:transposase
LIESAEQKLVVRRVFRNGRRQYDPASKARLVAECLLPDVSVSRVALDTGVNANLLRKWIKEAQGTGPEGGLSRPAFIPVVMEECSLPTGKAAARGENCLAGAERAGPFSTPVKVSASLPNGVTLTVECGDERTVCVMIGALSHVSAAR